MEDLYLYGLIAWFILVGIAIINGTVREKIFNRLMIKHKAHQLSSIIFIVLIFIVAFIFLIGMKIQASQSELLLMGLMWLILTMMFEFIFGHYVAAIPWKKLWADYNIFEGRLWLLVLLAVFIAPWLVSRIILLF